MMVDCWNVHGESERFETRLEKRGLRLWWVAQSHRQLIEVGPFWCKRSANRVKRDPAYRALFEQPADSAAAEPQEPMESALCHGRGGVSGACRHHGTESDGTYTTTEMHSIAAEAAYKTPFALVATAAIRGDWEPAKALCRRQPEGYGRDLMRAIQEAVKAKQEMTR